MPTLLRANYDANFVRRLFDEFAPAYHLTGRLSFGLDNYVRRKGIRLVSSKAINYCDMMSGSGQNWKLIQKHSPGALITAVDFSKGMNQMAQPDSRVTILQQCATATSLASNSMDAVVCTFGVKTLNHSQQTDFCKEILRILKPGGEFVILEFSKPAPFPFGIFYWLYFRVLSPILLLLAGKKLKHHYLLQPYVEEFGNISYVQNGLKPGCSKLIPLTYLFGMVTGIKGVK
ncbi:MAG: class I SAM-dependent methyltransferase [Chitinophagales bacterium]